MAHSVGLKIDDELRVGNVDIKVIVEQDGERLGVLKASRARWTGSPASEEHAVGSGLGAVRCAHAKFDELPR